MNLVYILRQFTKEITTAHCKINESVIISNKLLKKNFEFNNFTRKNQAIVMK